MKVKKLISGCIAVLLAIVSLTLVVSADATEISVSVTLRANSANTLIATAVKTSPDTHYDEFKWTGGTVNTLTIWIRNYDGYIMGPKIGIAKNAGFVKIWYRADHTFTTNSSAYMYPIHIPDLCGIDRTSLGVTRNKSFFHPRTDFLPCGVNYCIVKSRRMRYDNTYRIG